MEGSWGWWVNRFSSFCFCHSNSEHRLPIVDVRFRMFDFSVVALSVRIGLFVRCSMVGFRIFVFDLFAVGPWALGVLIPELGLWMLGLVSLVLDFRLRFTVRDFRFPISDVGPPFLGSPRSESQTPTPEFRPPFLDLRISNIGFGIPMLGLDDRSAIWDL